MPTSTSNRPKMPAINAPTGFWKVLSIIAERIPPHQLIWLAIILCICVLCLGALTYAGICRAAESKSVANLTQTVKQFTTSKDASTP